MCGITGIIHPKASQALISAMTDVMYSRGPDGAGYHVDDGVAMGMRRLSIIDLEHGWQPLFSGEQSIVAFQNGEIYNHARLRSELQGAGYEFKTQSDTEVIAHGYHCWGISGLVSRLDGMYAIAILDKRQRVLHLVRDRFGEKPLFLASFDKGVAYASDMRILAALPGVGADLSLEGVNAYLALHYVPGRQTILEKVQRVLPGERVAISLDSLERQFERYYMPPIGATRKLSDDELAQRLESAVSSRLVSDVPVGVFLSGGLDSSIVASIAAQKVKGIATFSMGFHSAEHDESEFAKLLARQIGSEHHHFMFDENSFASLLPKVAAALDEPIGDQALLPTYWLCHEASQHVKVVLAGEGADEIFAGYGYYSQFSAKPTLRDRVKALLGRAQRQPAQRVIHNAVPVTPSGFPLLTDIDGRKALLGDKGETVSEWERDVILWLSRAADPLQRATAADLVTWLPDDLLVKFDRMAMANSLEGRAPFLDPAVVEAGTMGLMPEERMHGGISKVALRRVAKRWLPLEIQDRKKQGFVLPMRQWISNWASAQGNLAEGMAGIPLYGDLLAPLGRALSNSIANEPTRERFHFAVLMLCEWSKAFQQKVAVLQSNFAEKMN